MMHIATEIPGGCGGWPSLALIEEPHIQTRAVLSTFRLQVVDCFLCAMLPSKIIFRKAFLFSPWNKSKDLGEEFFPNLCKSGLKLAQQ